MVRALVLRVLEGDKEVKRVSVDEDLLELVLKRKKDLGTNWFGRLLSAVFSATPKKVTITDEGGNNVSVYSYLVVASHSITDCNNRVGYIREEYFVGVLYPWIAVGVGQTAPTRNDQKLETEVARQPASTVYTDDTGVVVINAAFTFDSDTQITEVGLLLCPNAATCGGSGTCMLADRTVLDTPVSIAAGQTLYVEYRIAI